MAKQKTEDAEWDALTQKAVLQKSGLIVRARTIYDQNNWEACLLQPWMGISKAVMVKDDNQWNFKAQSL